MRRIAAFFLAAAILLAAGCASTPDGDTRSDLYLAVALETAVGTLISLEATGTLPAEGAGFIDATLAYGSGACVILGEPEMTNADKRVALMGMAPERAAFDAAFAALVAADLATEVRLAVLPVINGARAAVRVALTEEIDADRYARPCASVKALADSWEMQRPGGPELALAGGLK